MMSNQLAATPSVTIAYPNLPDKGCFVATAAFGADWTAEVQVLRDFRDAFLVTNEPGRRFTDWYYRNGPAAADFIDRTPILKPVVRALLVPFVAGSLFLLAAPFPAVFAVAVLLSLLILSAVRRRVAGVRS
jgi:hypothetical protein